MDQGNRKVSKGGISGVISIIAFFLLIVAILWLDQNDKSTHYKQGTQIQGLDCSKLTVEEAKREDREPGNRYYIFQWQDLQCHGERTWGNHQ